MLSDLQHGRSRAMCVYGDRGVGKTSVAHKICHMARQQPGLLVLQLYAGACLTHEDLMCSLVEAYLLSCMQDKGLSDEAMVWTERYLSQEIPGMPLRHSLLMQDADMLWQNLKVLTGLMAKHSQKQHLLISIDDVPEALAAYAIPHLLHMLLYQAAGMFPSLSIGIVLYTQRGIHDALAEQLPNLAMAVDWVELKPLTMQETMRYADQQLRNADKRLRTSQLELLYHYSKGNPLLLQLLAEGIYRHCASSEPDHDTFLRALAHTGILARKRLADPVLRKILCITDYHSLRYESQHMVVAI